jgi:hypothetical protein
MYTKPSISDLLHAVVLSLGRDVAPDVGSTRGKLALLMAQSLIQCAIQRLAAEPTTIVTEHNEMTALYRGLAECVQGLSGEAAARIQQRGATLGAYPDVPAPVPAAELSERHHRLSEGLIETLDDLDGMLQAGEAQAAAALELLRKHLMVRSMRDFQTLMVNPGSLVGRD